MRKKIIRITTIPHSFEGLLRGQLKYMSQHYDVMAISSNGDGFLSKYGKKEELRVIPVEMTRKITPLHDLKASWKLYKIFKKEKPFIVHTHTPKAGTLGMFAAYLAGVPHRLHTIAGLPLLEVTGRKRKLLDFIEKCTYFFATKIYPNSYGLSEIILANEYCKKEKLKVLGNGSSNGIDTDFFDPGLFSSEDKLALKKSLNIPPADFVFIFVGRVVKDKGINELISAFEKLYLDYKDITLLLAGYHEKDLDPISEASLSSINQNPKIRSLGPQKDVRPFFSIANVLTFPSYREGFPNVVMEAGAMGIPSIVTNINGCNEIVFNGQSGIIIPPKDVSALYNAMKNIYLDKDHQEVKLSPEDIRKTISSRYNRKLMWQEILQEYRSLYEPDQMAYNRY